MYITKSLRRISDLYFYTGGNCYLSFSGGKDSTIVLSLIKMAIDKKIIPDRIKAIYVDTGIELTATNNFVKWINDNYYGIDIIKPYTTFAEITKQYGKPAISKMKSELIARWQKNNMLKSAQMLLSNGKSTRLADKHLHFLSNNFDIKISNKCCELLKKKPFNEYNKQNNILGYMTGERMDEGGARSLAFSKRDNICTIVRSNGIIVKNPIIDWGDEMCELYVNKYNLPLSDAYIVYGLGRTGCYCCPFSKDLINNLKILYKYEPNKYKAALYYLGDVYIAQGVKLEFDKMYMDKFNVKWECYSVDRYEMLKKYRPNCRIVSNWEKNRKR